MAHYRGLLTPEERARVTEVQDLLIERFVAFREAMADGREGRAKELGGRDRQSSPGQEGD